MKSSLRTHPAISVLIPCHRATPFVASAVESALAQDYPHLEVIVAPDDAQSYEFLRDTLSTTRLRIIPPRESSSQGAGATRNHAIDHAAGDYFFCLDADDRLPPQLLSSLMPDAIRFGAVVGPTHYVDDQGESVRYCEPPPQLMSVAGYSQQLASFRPLISRRLEVGYRSIFAEDILHDLHVIALNHGAMRTLPDAPAYELRVHAASATAVTAEARIQTAYLDAARDLQLRPTTLGVQGLPASIRAQLVEAFRFRHFVSQRYAALAAPMPYPAFVGQQQARLWDAYQATLRQATGGGEGKTPCATTSGELPELALAS